MSPTLKGKTIFCPQCGEDLEIEETKTWELIGGKGGQDFRVHAYRCKRCKKAFRKMERI